MTKSEESDKEGGNRQMLSVGNLAGEERVALFFMDYPGRRRLKILGRARVHRAEPETVARLLGEEAVPARLERVLEIEVVGFDWNCPQHITPRYSEDEVAALTARLRGRIRELEARLDDGGA